MRICGELLIERPIDEVFSFATDERNEPSYHKAMVRAVKTTPGPVGAGTRFLATMRAPVGHISMITDIVDYRPPQRAVSHTRLGSAEIMGTLTFAPVGSSTAMRWDWELRPRGVLRLAGPLLALVGRHQELRTWVAMKRMLEGRQPLEADARQGQARQGQARRVEGARS